MKAPLLGLQTRLERRRLTIRADGPSVPGAMLKLAQFCWFGGVLGCLPGSIRETPYRSPFLTLLLALLKGTLLKGLYIFKGAPNSNSRC